MRTIGYAGQLRSFFSCVKIGAMAARVAARSVLVSSALIGTPPSSSALPATLSSRASMLFSISSELPDTSLFCRTTANSTCTSYACSVAATCSSDPRSTLQ